MANPFVIMTGASGVGKTTIARTIRLRYPGITVSLDEELKRPPNAFMESIGPTEGPGGPFQRGFALYSVPALSQEREHKGPALLDCQCRIAFLKEALTRHHITNTHLVLVECDDATRETRLKVRGSPELANEQMKNWSRYLHAEAVEAGLDILNTGVSSLNENVAKILTYF